MIKAKFVRMLCTVLILTGDMALAYEIDTHAKLSEDAHNSSVISMDPNLLPNFGIKSTDVFVNSKNEKKTLVELIKDGARFEDTLSKPRPCNHFYNPLNGAPLMVKGIAVGSTSPDWALEDRGEITYLAGFPCVGNQEFSYRDAREFFYGALTGRDSAGTIVAATRAERDKYFGLTFQTLGQVIHHIQDMAQPQHVRNDIHLDFPWESIPNISGVENPSVYESWTNRKEVMEALPTDFRLIGYDITGPKFVETFSQPRKLWETTTGEGLSQFTNYNFVSAGTNFYNSGMFNFPLFTPSMRTEMDIQQMCINAKPACPNFNLSGKMTFYGNWVEDRYTGNKSLNPYASTRSIFDADLEDRSTRRNEG